MKGHPFEVVLSNPKSIGGAILSDQVKNLGCRQRHAKFIRRARDDVVNDVLAKQQTLIGS